MDKSADYTVCGNAELIRRGVENVVRNALRFPLAGQQIEVQLSAEQQWLAIVRKVVRAHHGEVKALNRPEGGLALTLRLLHWQQP